MLKIIGYIENLKSQKNPHNGRTFYSFKLGFRSKVNKSKVNPKGYSYCWFPAEVGTFEPTKEELHEFYSYGTKEYAELTIESNEGGKVINGDWYKIKSIKFFDEKPKFESNRTTLKGTVKNLKKSENGNNPEYNFLFEAETGDILNCVFFEKDAEKQSWNIKEGETYLMQFLPICLPEYDKNGCAKVSGNAKVYRRCINYIVMGYRVSKIENKKPINEDDDYVLSDANLQNASEDNEELEESDLSDDPEIEELHKKIQSERIPSRYTKPEIAKQPEIGNWTTMTKEETQDLIKEFEKETEEPNNQTEEPIKGEVKEQTDEVDLSNEQDEQEECYSRAEFPVEESYKDIAEDLYKQGIEEGIKQGLEQSKQNTNNEFVISLNDFKDLIKLADKCNRNEVAAAVLSKLEKAIIK